MRKILILLILFILSFSLIISSDKEDLKAIKRSLKAEESQGFSKPFNEAKWLKISIVERKKGGEEEIKIRIYLPFLEKILKTCKKCRINKGETEIDLKDLFKELKRFSSTDLLIAEDQEATVKIWLE